MSQENTNKSEEQISFASSACYEVVPPYLNSQIITWTKFNGEKQSLIVSHPNFEYARNEAIIEAKKRGWTPPRWWQWWRRNDTRINNHNARGEQ